MIDACVDFFLFVYKDIIIQKVMLKVLSKQSEQ